MFFVRIASRMLKLRSCLTTHLVRRIWIAYLESGLIFPNRSSTRFTANHTEVSARVGAKSHSCSWEGLTSFSKWILQEKCANLSLRIKSAFAHSGAELYYFSVPGFCAHIFWPKGPSSALCGPRRINRAPLFIKKATSFSGRLLKTNPSILGHAVTTSKCRGCEL